MVIKERNKMTISISFTPVWIEVWLQVEGENHNEDFHNGCINIEFPQEIRWGVDYSLLMEFIFLLSKSWKFYFTIDLILISCWILLTIYIYIYRIPQQRVKAYIPQSGEKWWAVIKTRFTLTNDVAHAQHHTHLVS